jgi:hypothetical protein
MQNLGHYMNMNTQKHSLPSRAFLAVLIFLFAGKIQAQNLVNDGSFESGDESFCGISGGE